MDDLRIGAADGTELAVSVGGEGPSLLPSPVSAPRGSSSTRCSRTSSAAIGWRCTTSVASVRGRSPGPFGTEQLGDDAAAVLDGLGVEQAIVLGASFGGMVAQQLALRHGGRVGILVLAATGPGSGHLVSEPDPAAAAALLGRGARTPEDAYRLACTVLYSRRFQEEHADFIEQQVHDRGRRPIAPGGFQAQLAASRGHDAWNELPSITAPTFVMHGSEDAVMPLANAELLAARIPGAVLEVFDGAGHLFFHEQPERTADAVAAFVAARG